MRSTDEHDTFYRWQLWHAFDTNRLEDLPLSEEQRAAIRRLSVFEPRPAHPARTLEFATAPSTIGPFSRGWKNETVKDFYRIERHAIAALSLPLPNQYPRLADGLVPDKPVT